MIKTDPSLCPLCGKENTCVMASDPDADVSTCWCMSTEIPVDLSPQETAKETCICKVCADKLRTEENSA